MQVWELEPGWLMVAGGFSDLALHHHAAVQVTVGGHGPLAVTCDGDTHDDARLVVIASGPRHAVRSDSGFGLGGRFAEAASEAAGALRLGLALGSWSPTQRRAGELVGIGDIP